MSIRKEQTMNNDITQHITLELSRPTNKSSLSVKKYDTNSRRVQISLTNNGGLVKLENVVMAIIKGTKPDGKVFWNDCTIVGDTIWAMVTTQMINVPGDVVCEVELTWKDETQLTSPQFYIHVYDTINTGAESQNEYNGIIQALAETINNREDSEKAQAKAETAQAAAEASEVASKASEEAAEQSSDTAKEYMNVTREYRDYTKNYVDAFIQEMEEDNKTLKLANAYTNEQIADVRGDTGYAKDLTTPISTTLVDAINSVFRLAAGQNQAISFSDYADIVSILMNLDETAFRTGQNMYVGTIGVPDLWVYGINEEFVEYTYTTDEAIVEEIAANGFIEIGWYKLSILETQKVDLTDINSAIADIYDRMGYPL